MRYNKVYLSLGVFSIIFSNAIAFILLKIYVKLIGIVTGGFAYEKDLWLAYISKPILILGTITVVYQLCIKIIDNYKNKQ